MHAACAGLNFYIIKLLLEHDEDPVTVDKRGNSTFQLMIKWNRIMKDLQSDYRVTFRLMMKEAKHKYGNDIGTIITRTNFHSLHLSCESGIHGPPGPRTDRSDLVRDFPNIVGPGPIWS